MRPNKIYIYLESTLRELKNDEIYQMSRFVKFLRIKKNRSYKNFFFNFQRIFCLLKNLTKIFTPFCRSRRADSKYIYFVGSLKVFFYYNYIIGGKNSMIVQIPCLVGTYILFHLILYSQNDFDSKKKKESGQIEKKTYQFM